MYQNYPNPFREITTIACYIPQAIQNAQLQVYDKCGMLVKSVVISERCATSVQITATELSGVDTYTYLLVGDGYSSEIMQIVLIR